MIRQGAFPQLSRILDAVQRANPMDDSDDEEDLSDDDDEENEPDRMYGLPGIPGEARVEMLSDDILERVRLQKMGGAGSADEAEEPKICEIEDSEYDEQQKELQADQEGDYNDDEISLPALPPVTRRTYVYSATLTLPATDSYRKSKKQKGRRQMMDVDGAIAEILEKSHAKGRTKVVDLTNATGSAKGAAANFRNGNGNRSAAPKVSEEFRLPPGLELKLIKCTQKHKDSHLYAYLMTTEEGASGPCLVFCNSIAAVRRVGATLQALGLDVRILHAHMQQVRILFLSLSFLCSYEEHSVSPKPCCVKMTIDRNVTCGLREQSLSITLPTKLVPRLIDANRVIISELTLLPFQPTCYQRARFKAVESLKNGKSRQIVVSTDVAARGLDIPSVSSVVHYDVARTVDTYVHRSGRTAVSYFPSTVLA